jgi:hypothetical protein
MSFLDDAISNLGQSLAQTAVATANQETGYNVGGALNALFGTGQTTGGQNLGNLPAALGSTTLDTSLLNTVLGAVNQQTAQLQALGTQLSSLATQIMAIQGEIENIQQLLNVINEEQLYLSWQVQDQPVSQLIAQIRSSHQNYGNYIAESSDTQSYDVTQFVNGILSQNVVSSASSVINSAIVGTGGQSKGLLKLWSDMVLPLVKNGTIDYRNAVAQYMDYYKRLAYAQLQATNLVMEAYNFNPTPAPLPTPTEQAKKQWTTYRQYLLSQEEPFIDSLFPLVVAGEEYNFGNDGPGGTFVYPFTAPVASMELNPELQSSPPTPPGGGALPTAYYAPSQLFREAEQLLANLYVTESQDRRIVVYMTCVDNTSGLNYPVLTLVDNVTLTLGVNALQPTASAKTTYPGYYFSVCDTNWFVAAEATSLYLKRFVFSADANNSELQDGTHNLTNLNGVNGLVPLQRTMGNVPGPFSVPFMSDNIVAYGLTIGPSSPFDFMNFAAYNTPLPNIGFVYDGI